VPGAKRPSNSLGRTRAAAGRFFFGSKGATSYRCHSQNRKIIGANYIGEPPRRALFFTQADHGEVMRHEAGEKAVPFTDIEPDRIRKSAK
jgi:hypothetical protein